MALGAGFTVTVTIHLIYYAVQPLLGLLVDKRMGFDLVRMLVLGVAMAWMNK